MTASTHNFNKLEEKANSPSTQLLLFVSLLLAIIISVISMQHLQPSQLQVNITIASVFALAYLAFRFYSRTLRALAGPVIISLLIASLGLSIILYVLNLGIQ